MDNDKLLQYQALFEEAITGITATTPIRAKAEAEYKNLDAFTKTVLAGQYNIKVGGQKDKEMLALNSNVYQVHLEGLNEARSTYLRARALEDVAKAKFDYAQSQMSLEKAKMGLR